MEETPAFAKEVHHRVTDERPDRIGMHAQTVERVSRRCALLVRPYAESRIVVAPAAASEDLTW